MLIGGVLVVYLLFGGAIIIWLAQRMIQTVPFFWAGLAVEIPALKWLYIALIVIFVTVFIIVLMVFFVGLLHIVGWLVPEIGEGIRDERMQRNEERLKIRRRRYSKSNL